MTTKPAERALAGLQAYVSEARRVRADRRQRRIGGLRAYIRDVERLRERASDARDGLARYVEQAPGLVRADAQMRYRELLARIPRALVEADFPSSLLSLIQIEVTDETRHSLLLAALLDPGRSGPLAEWLWPKLIKCIDDAIGPVESNKLDPPPRKALNAWKPELLDDMVVEPTEHNYEFENLDVFARVERDGEYLFGLVVENKVKPGTKEQDDQLWRYWDLIGKRFDRDYDRTVFVFLTERPREDGDRWGQRQVLGAPCLAGHRRLADQGLQRHREPEVVRLSAAGGPPRGPD